MSYTFVSNDKGKNIMTYCDRFLEKYVKDSPAKKFSLIFEMNIMLNQLEFQSLALAIASSLFLNCVGIFCCKIGDLSVMNAIISSWTYIEG